MRKAKSSNPSPNGDMTAKMAEFTRAMVGWYQPRRRPFPWRDSTDPYFITICELFLQRTNAEKVEKVALEFFGRCPNPDNLHSANPQEIERILKPLGLPHRIGQVYEIAAAFARMQQEKREVQEEDLRALPGVGPYVASAVKVLALGKSDAVIDEHVLRQFRRVFSLHAPPRRHPRKEIRDFALKLVPEGYAKEYNLAILDNGRLNCRPSKPQCSYCAVRDICDHANSGGLVI